MLFDYQVFSTPVLDREKDDTYGKEVGEGRLTLEACQLSAHTVQRCEMTYGPLMRLFDARRPDLGLVSDSLT